MNKIRTWINNYLDNFQLYLRQTIDEKFNGMYRLDKFESFDSVSGKWITANYKIINDSTIGHHRISATEPKNFGTTLIRSFEFINDTLILTAQENLDNKKMRLRWVRL